MARRLRCGDKILLLKNPNSVVGCTIHVWDGHPALDSLGSERSVVDINDDMSILLVLDVPLKTKYHWWLRCLHPTFDLITLDQVNYLGYANDHASYTIELCE